MPQITRLVAGKKNPGRINLYLDGEFAFALSIDEVVKNGLKKGLELTVDQVEALKKNDDLLWAYTKILNYLSFRPRTEFEVRARLKKYDITETASVDWIINKLKENNYLSDLEFARWFVDSRMSNRPRSKQHLSAELRAKGVSADVINQVLLYLNDSAPLEALISKKATLSRDKLLQFLLRRGFKYSAVQAKLDEMAIKG
jgi:regulatory protein